MISDPREIAERMARSFSSDLKAFIYDNRLVDSRVVERLIALSGFDSYIDRYAEGNIVTYYINPSKIKRKCHYEKCSDKPLESLASCISECLASELERVSREVADTILEVARNLKA